MKEDLCEPTDMELRVRDAIAFAPTYCGDNNYLAMARAAIRAMRYPTIDMLRDAGVEATCSPEDIAFMWQVMIDSASPEEK